MNKKIFKVMIGFGIFGAGVVFGKQIQKVFHNKKILYAGTLQVYDMDGEPELYLALSVLPEDLVNSADVIFKVNKIRSN